jgi:hypothetical protein
MLKIKRKIRLIVKRNRLLHFLYYDVYVEIRYRYKRKRKMIQKYGFELLEDIHSILNQEKIEFFVDFGTLLGIIREKSFIKHDLDMDVGVIKQDDETIKKVKDLLINNGCVLKYEYIYKGKLYSPLIDLEKIFVTW